MVNIWMNYWNVYMRQDTLAKRFERVEAIKIILLFC
ncbi:hypothetical protein MAMMFC1_00920 [Methylomusa anaerophila]|uniref:Uncharacterized protein n=1 Tax=Methylomusa anaerophila TaxID=1930071 RepID=A0A348AGS4_9FIRM|nr:hypothetical protein MAMMFC1_00920 [Methylomusa anaerophila]